jgi:hypothetical protein
MILLGNDADKPTKAASPFPGRSYFVAGLSGAGEQNHSDEGEAAAVASIDVMLTPDRRAIQAINYGWRFDQNFSAEMLDLSMTMATHASTRRSCARPLNRSTTPSRPIVISFC